MTDNDALVRELEAAILGADSADHLRDKGLWDTARLVETAAEVLAALRSTPQAYPVSIGRLHLGEKRSNGERLCNWGHEVLVGHPLYWPQAISQYDDSDPCCIEHAIEQYASEAGYGADAPNLPPPPPSQPGAVVNQCLAELGDAEPLVVSKEDDGWAVRTLSAWRLMHPAGDDALREENARLRGALRDASVSLWWAARQMKGNCNGGAVDAVNLAAEDASSVAAFTGRQG